MSSLAPLYSAFYLFVALVNVVSALRYLGNGAV